MKVIHVETGRNLYGGALQVVYLLRGLHAAHPEVQNILVCAPQSGIAEAVRGTATQVIELPIKGDLDFSFAGRLAKLLRAESPDVLHLHSRRGGDLWGGVAGKMCGIPTLLTRRVDNPEPRLWVNLKYRLYEHIVTISHGIRDVLLAEGLTPERVTCIHSATDTEHYQPGGDKAWLHKEFNLPPNTVTIAVVAQLIERKGHRFFFDALPDIIQQHPNVRILIFGKGALESELRAHATRLSLQNNVQFVGFRNDLNRILPCIDLLVHPALIEGLGVSLLQAAACEVPIIASNAGGMPEAVQHNHTGLLVPPGNTPALQQAVLELLNHPEKRQHMGQAGRNYILQNFSVARMAEENYRQYRRLMGTR